MYQDLFEITFGGWDETRHNRHFSECWKQGGISIVEVDGVRVGMLQLFEHSDRVDIGEIQILPQRQNLGIGASLLNDTVARAHGQAKNVLLSLGLMNERAFRLYKRLGFEEFDRTDTHIHMECAHR